MPNLTLAPTTAGLSLTLASGTGDVLTLSPVGAPLSLTLAPATGEALTLSPVGAPLSLTMAPATSMALDLGPASAALQLTMAPMLRGERGLPGAPGGAAAITVAGEALGGHRAVIFDATGTARYASNTNPAHLGRFAGITQSAAVSGADVLLATSGSMVVEPSWAWVADAPVYLGANGLPTQTAPTSGFMQILGMALNATTLFLNPREPIAT